MYDLLSLTFKALVRMFRLSPLGAAAGLCIGLILYGLILYAVWPKGVMDDPLYGLTLIVLAGAIPFLLFMTGLGVIGGRIVEIVILLREDKKHEKELHREDCDLR